MDSLPKVKILSSLTQPHVVLKHYDLPNQHIRMIPERLLDS